MKKSLLSAFLVLGAVLGAQTTLVSPSVGNGGFESGDTGWNIINGSQVNAWRVSTGAAPGFSGTNSIYISNSSSAPYAHAYNTGSTSVVHFYKDITFPAGETNVGLSFDYLVQGEGSNPYWYDYLRIYVVPTSYTPTEGVEPDVSVYPDNWLINLEGNSWKNTYINIPQSAIGNATSSVTKRLLFVWVNDSSVGTQPPAAIDNITVTSTALNCPTITSPTVNAQSVSLTPTITWSSVPTATSYRLSVGTTPGGTDVVNNVDVGLNTSYTFQNTLGIQTTYYYSVRTVAGNTTSGNCQINKFTTGCSTFSAPYVQNFDGGALPNCWTNANPTYTGTTTAAFWRFSGSPGYGVTNNGRPSGSYAWVDASSPYSATHNVELTSPAIDLTGLSTPTITFEWFKNHLTSATGSVPNYDNNKLTLAVNDGSGWIDLWNSTTNAANWREVEIELPASYLNKTIHARFTVDKDVAGNGYYYDDLLLDNFKIDNKVTCSKPINLTLGTLSGSNMTVTWTAPTPAPASGYEVYYSTNPTAPTSQTVPTLTNVTTTSATIPGSTTNITYVWVRSVCDSTSKSDWTNNVNFILPPVNDNCIDAIPLTVGPNFDAYPLVGNITGATTDIQPSCSYDMAANVWFKFVVPASGSVTVETKEIVGSDLDDTIIAVYSGNCGALTEIDCNDDGNAGNFFSDIHLTNQTPGSTLYLHVQKYSSGSYDGTFRVAAYDPSILATQEVGVSKKLNVYPNPFKDVINIVGHENYVSGVVVDTSGKIVKVIDKVENTLNLTGLASGMYILNMTSKTGGKVSVKLIKN